MSVQHCHNEMEDGALNIKKHLSDEVREHSLLLFTWLLEMLSEVVPVWEMQILFKYLTI